MYLSLLTRPEGTQNIPVVNLNRFPPFFCFFFLSSQRLPCAGRQMVFVTQGSRQLFPQRLLFPHENRLKISPPCVNLLRFWGHPLKSRGPAQVAFLSPTPLQHPPVTTVTELIHSNKLIWRNSCGCSSSFMETETQALLRALSYSVRK